MEANNIFQSSNAIPVTSGSLMDLSDQSNGQSTLLNLDDQNILNHSQNSFINDTLTHFTFEEPRNNSSSYPSLEINQGPNVINLPEPRIEIEADKDNETISSLCSTVTPSSKAESKSTNEDNDSQDSFPVQEPECILNENVEFPYEVGLVNYL